MNRRTAFAAALAGLLAVRPALAQDVPPQNVLPTFSDVTFQISQRNSVEVRLDPAALERQMAEDIAIMRRILDRTVRRTYGDAALRQAWDRHLLDVTGAVAKERPARLLDATREKQAEKIDRPVALLDYDGDGRLDLVVQGCPGQFHAFPETQGVYLTGYGVVFTAVSPRAFPQASPGAAAPARKPLSEWERLRKELRGEKVEAEKAPEPKEPSLADAVLKVLAENGRHFRQLSNPDERITVAITFQAAQACVQCHVSPWEPKAATSKSEPAAADVSRSLLEAITTGKPAGEKSVERVLLGGLVAETKTLDADNYALLADLHLKQGKYDEAVQAFQKALQLKPSAELYGKLAQAHLAAGDKTKAHSALAKALEALDQALAAGGKPASPAPPTAPALPAQLILSAPKKVLDRVGEGKMSFDEFRKAATVESVNVAAGPKGKASDAAKP